MTSFDKVSGRAIPLMRDDIDTDPIVRIERLTQTDQSGLGAHALGSLRHKADGSLDPESPLNQARYAGSPILIAGRNFGCGSSREAAVWALSQMGLRVVIFHANCFENGLLPIRMPHDQVEHLAAAASKGEMLTVALGRCVIEGTSLDGLSFAIDAAQREALLLGVDIIGLTLRDADAIAAWHHADRRRRPWVWDLPLAPAASPPLTC